MARGAAVLDDLRPLGAPPSAPGRPGWWFIGVRLMAGLFFAFLISIGPLLAFDQLGVPVLAPQPFVADGVVAWLADLTLVLVFAVAAAWVTRAISRWDWRRPSPAILAAVLAVCGLVPLGSQTSAALLPVSGLGALLAAVALLRYTAWDADGLPRRLLAGLVPERRRALSLACGVALGAGVLLTVGFGVTHPLSAQGEVSPMFKGPAAAAGHLRHLPGARATHLITLRNSARADVRLVGVEAGRIEGGGLQVTDARWEDFSSDPSAVAVTRRAGRRDDQVAGFSGTARRLPVTVGARGSGRLEVGLTSTACPPGARGGVLRTLRMRYAVLGRTWTQLLRLPAPVRTACR